MSGRFDEVEINIGQLKQNSSEILDMTIEFQNNSSKINDNLNDFFQELDFVINNSERIKAITKNITNEIGIGNGKADHILFKLLAYKVFIYAQNPSEIQDETQCKFGEWLDANKVQIKDDMKLLNLVTKDHQNVHAGVKEAISFWRDGKNYEDAIKRMQSVEASSEKAFEELYANFIKNRI